MLAIKKLVHGDELPGVPIASLSSDHRQTVFAVDGSKEGDQYLATPPGDTFVPIPEIRPQVASHLHVCGASGCGKSTFADLYARQFKHFTGGKVVVISADTQPDANLTHIDGRVGIDETIGDLPLERIAAGSAGRPTLLIFDDCEGLGKSKEAALRTFVQAVKERGRKMGISSLSVYHKGAGNSTTRDSLAEATAFVIFPARLTSNTEYMLKRYAGIPGEVSSLIRRGGWGHWVIITPGQSILGEKKAAVVDPAVLSSIARAEKKKLTDDATAALRQASKTDRTGVVDPRTATAQLLSALDIDEEE